MFFYEDRVFFTEKFCLVFIELWTWLFYLLYSFIPFFIKILSILTWPNSAFFYPILLETNILLGVVCKKQKLQKFTIQKLANNNLKPSIVLLKSTILDIWHWSECTSVASKCYSFSYLFISFRCCPFRHFIQVNYQGKFGNFDNKSLGFGIKISQKL